MQRVDVVGVVTSLIVELHREAEGKIVLRARLAKLPEIPDAWDLLERQRLFYSAARLFRRAKDAVAL